VTSGNVRWWASEQMRRLLLILEVPVGYGNYLPDLSTGCPMMLAKGVFEANIGYRVISEALVLEAAPNAESLPNDPARTEIRPCRRAS